MKNQNGSTLIIVLIILVLVTLVGAIAVKSSILDLKISTNSQVRSLLLENSNSALFNLEDPNQIARHLALDGMFSYFNSVNNVDDELVFCYRQSATSTFYANTKMSVITKDGKTTKMGVTGFCNGKEFSSGRSVIQSQIYMKKNTVETGTPFSTVPEGISLGQENVPVVAHNIGVTVVSVLPSFSTASKSEIEDCFKKTAIKKDTSTTTVMECFTELDMPFNVQHADYIVGGSPKLKS